MHKGKMWRSFCVMVVHNHVFIQRMWTRSSSRHHPQEPPYMLLQLWGFLFTNMRPNVRSITLEPPWKSIWFSVVVAHSPHAEHFFFCDAFQLAMDVESACLCFFLWACPTLTILHQQGVPALRTAGSPRCMLMFFCIMHTVCEMILWPEKKNPTKPKYSIF